MRNSSPPPSYKRQQCFERRADTPWLGPSIAQPVFLRQDKQGTSDALLGSPGGESSCSTRCTCRPNRSLTLCFRPLLYTPKASKEAPASTAQLQGQTESAPDSAPNVGGKRNPNWDATP